MRKLVLVAAIVSIGAPAFAQTGLKFRVRSANDQDVGAKVTWTMPEVHPEGNGSTAVGDGGAGAAGAGAGGE